LFDAGGSLAGWKNNQNGEIKNVVGKTGVKSLGFSGIHVLNTFVFDKFIETGAFNIIDAYLRLAQNEKITAFDHSEGKWMEFGRVENIENALKNPDFIELVTSLGL
jgi:NDP-sugar pyrophosphorylase family protein